MCATDFGYRVYKGVAGDGTSSSLFAEAMTASFSVVVKTSRVHVLNAVFLHCEERKLRYLQHLCRRLGCFFMQNGFGV